MKYPTMEEVLTAYDKKCAARHEAMAGLADDLAAAVRVAEACDPEGVRTSVYIASVVDRVDIDVCGMDSWDELQPYADALVAEGFELGTASDHTDSLMRLVRCKRDREDHHTSVMLAGILKGDAVCKVVETDETTPVLKFVCPGDADYPKEAEEVTP